MREMNGGGISAQPASLWPGGRSWLGLAFIWLAGALALVLYLFIAARAVGNFGFPLDDSWIHLQIARNLASGHGWSFNPGVLTGASTAPLWAALLAPLFWLPGDVTVWVKGLGSLFFFLDIALVAYLAWCICEDRRVAIAAGLLASWQPSFVWGALSGMEVPLYLCLFLLGAINLARVERRGARAAYAGTAWLMLAGWARPELWTLLPLAWGYLAILRYRRRGQESTVFIGRWWGHAALAVAGIGAFLLFNLAVWGHPLPSTLAAKAGFIRGSSHDGLFVMLLKFGGGIAEGLGETLASQNAILVAFLALGGVVAWRSDSRRSFRWLLLLAFLVLASIVVIARVHVGSVAFQTYRRSAHALVSMNVLVAFGALALWDTVRGTLARRPEHGPGRSDAEAERGRLLWWRAPDLRLVLMLGLGLLALVVQAYALYQGGRQYANDLRSINQADVAAGEWVAANTPPDALIGVNDIGAIAYFGGRRVLDLIGLASPEAIPVMAETMPKSPERDRRTRELLVAQGCAYVIIFPEWFPSLAQDPILTPVERFVVPGLTALAEDTVVVFRVVKQDE